MESSYEEFEESTFKSEEVRQVVNYSPAAAHEVLKAIAEKTGMNPVTKVRVNGRLRKLTSKTLMQIHVRSFNLEKLKSWRKHFSVKVQLSTQ